MKRNILLCAMALGLMLTGCSSHYELTNVTRCRVLIDKTYDNQTDAEAQAFIAPYKHKVDSVMSPVIGHAAEYMWAEKPESNLSDLLADILVWASNKYGEKPVMGLYNMGGMRAALPQGVITYGDILEVAPFENKICFFDMSGESMLKLFQQIAANRGEGVSHGVNLVITKNGELLSAKLNGEEIDPQKTYRVTSIDYLAQGNDGLTALKEKTNVNSPQEKSNDLRFIIMDYFKDAESRGEAVSSKVEGRIVVK